MIIGRSLAMHLRTISGELKEGDYRHFRHRTAPQLFAQLLEALIGKWKLWTTIHPAALAGAESLYYALVQLISALSGRPFENRISTELRHRHKWNNLTLHYGVVRVHV